MGRLSVPTRGLKYGFQGTINAIIPLKNSFSPSGGGGGGASVLRLGL